MGADSAVLRPSEPVFLPESGNTALMTAIPAVRIGRLGFCVRSNFTSYVDAATLFIYIQPHPDDTPDWLPPYIADRSFSPGKWCPLPADGFLRGRIALSPLPGRKGVSDSYEFTTTLEQLRIERLIRELSRFCTIKTGDLLLFPDSGTPMIPAELDTAVTATFNNEKVLDVRLK